MHALHAVVQQGHHIGIGVEQVQELHAGLGRIGVGGDGHHGALHGGVVNIGIAVGHDVGHLDAAGGGGGVLIAVEGNLGGDEVVGGVLGVAPGIGGGFADGDGGVDVARVIVLLHLGGEGLELVSGILVHEHVAVGAGLGHVVGVHDVAQQQAGVAGDDGGVVHKALHDSALKHEGIEHGAVGFLTGLHLGEDLVPAVEAGLLHVLQGVAVLFQQGHVHVPAVHGGEILEAGHSVNALLAVGAFGHGALKEQFGQGVLQRRAIFRQQVVLGVVQADIRAGLGILGILVLGPGAGEHDVVLIGAGGHGVEGQIVEVGPGAPHGLDGHADLFGQVGVQLFQYGGIVGHVVAFQQDGDFHRVLGHGGHDG